MICERCGARVTGSVCDLCGGTRLTAAPAAVPPAPVPPAAATGHPAPGPPSGPWFAPAKPAAPTPSQPIAAVRPPSAGVRAPSSRRGALVGAAIGVAVLAVIGWQVGTHSTTPRTSDPGPGAAAPDASSGGPADGDQSALAACDVSGATIAATLTAPDGTDGAGNTIGYAAQNLIDGDQSTAWRAPGSGVGETVSLEFSQPCKVSAVSLLNGYHKVDPVDGTDRWKQNRRVSKLEIRAGSSAIVANLDAHSKRWQEVRVQASGVTRITFQILGSAPSKPARDYLAVSEIRTV